MATKLPYETYKSIYSKVPRLCVDLVIKSPQGVLLTLRNLKPKGYWHLPGGTILLNESVEEAVHRVAKEELGVEIIIDKYLGIVDFYKGYVGLGHPISIEYAVHITEGKITLDQQATEFGYFKKVPPRTLKHQKEFLHTLNFR